MALFTKYKLKIIKMVDITELSCRVCLHEQDIMINIYDELEDLQTNLSSLLITCGDLQICKNDVFPKYLCEECTRELLITSKFREKCFKSKQMFNEILQQNNESELREAEKLNGIIKYTVKDVHNIIEVYDDIIEESHTIEGTEQQQIPEENVEHVIVEESLALPTSKEVSVPFQFELINDANSDSIFVQNADITEDSVSSVVDPNLVPFDDNEVELNKIHPEDKTICDNIKDIPFKCDICGVIYKQAINLKKHLQKTHAPSRSFTCEKCDHWFSLETVFNKHILSCNYIATPADDIQGNKHTKMDKIFLQCMEPDNDRKCVYCEREFPTPFALRMHLRTHTGERPFQCKYCIKSFKTQSALNVHNKRHTGQADYVCTVCNKTFYEQSNLSVHMRSHTGDRPHICAVCNKTFTRVFLLQIHMRIHTGERPFYCLYCDKSFRQTADLRSHLTKHTGHKKYSCSLCSKSYIRRADLIHHMPKHSVIELDEENDEMVANEQDIKEDSVDINIQNSEVLYSFDDIIESEDVIVQSDDIS